MSSGIFCPKNAAPPASIIHQLARPPLCQTLKKATFLSFFLCVGAEQKKRRGIKQQKMVGFLFSVSEVIWNRDLEGKILSFSHVVIPRGSPVPFLFFTCPGLFSFSISPYLATRNVRIFFSRTKREIPTNAKDEMKKKKEFFSSHHPHKP